MQENKDILFDFYYIFDSQQSAPEFQEIHHNGTSYNIYVKFYELRRNFE